MLKVAPRLYRGPRPSTSSDLLGLRSLGIDTTLCLQTGIYEAFHNDAYEELRRLPVNGILRVNYPIGDFLGPSAQTLRAAVSNIQDLLSQREGLLVHCRLGVDRTGMVIAAYRMLVQGWSLARAEGEMDLLGFHDRPYCFWKHALAKLAKEIS